MTTRTFRLRQDTGEAAIAGGEVGKRIGAGAEIVEDMQREPSTNPARVRAPEQDHPKVLTFPVWISVSASNSSSRSHSRRERR